MKRTHADSNKHSSQHCPRPENLLCIKQPTRKGTGLQELHPKSGGVVRYLRASTMASATRSTVNHECSSSCLGISRSDLPEWCFAHSLRPTTSFQNTALTGEAPSCLDAKRANSGATALAYRRSASLLTCSSFNHSTSQRATLSLMNASRSGSMSWTG